MNRPRKPYRIPFHLISVFIVLSLGIAIAGHVYHGIQKTDLRESKQDELAAIAELKVSQIMRWRRELLGDAQVIVDNRFIASFIEAYIETPAIVKIENDLFRIVRKVASQSGEVQVTKDLFGKGNAKEFGKARFLAFDHVRGAQQSEQI